MSKLILKVFNDIDNTWMYYPCDKLDIYDGEFTRSSDYSETDMLDVIAVLCNKADDPSEYDKVRVCELYTNAVKFRVVSIHGYLDEVETIGVARGFLLNGNGSTIERL